jgi:hypothetical protein
MAADVADAVTIGGRAHHPANLNLSGIDAARHP